MSATLRKPMTLEEFLAWEESQELRWEFDGFAPVAITGGTRAHETICVNVLVALQTRLAGGPCRAFGTNLKIEVAGRIRYPDAFVVCSPGPAQQTIVKDPVVVFEVISDSTGYTDRHPKLREYGVTPSIQRYVILEQDVIAATVFTRQGPGFMAAPLQAGDTLDMPEIGISVPMTEFYEGLELEPPIE